MYIQRNGRRRVYAADDFDVVDDVPVEDAAVDVAPEATDLLFEAEDVAELVAEVTQMPVEVEVADDGDSVTFAVGEDEFLVEAEGDEEILESRRIPRRRRPVSATTRRTAPARKAPARKAPVKSSRTVRKTPSRRR